MRTTNGSHHNPDRSTQPDIDHHPLPSVYYARFKELKASFKAHTEYALEVTLACPGVESIITIVAPLLLRSRATPQPIQDKEYGFAIGQTWHTVRSKVLLPENSERRMTFRVKSRRLLTPYKKPRCTFTLKVVHP